MFVRKEKRGPKAEDTGERSKATHPSCGACAHIQRNFRPAAPQRPPSSRASQAELSSWREVWLHGGQLPTPASRPLCGRRRSPPGAQDRGDSPVGVHSAQGASSGSLAPSSPPPQAKAPRSLASSRGLGTGARVPSRQPIPLSSSGPASRNPQIRPRAPNAANQGAGRRLRDPPDAAGRGRAERRGPAELGRRASQLFGEQRLWPATIASGIFSPFPSQYFRELGVSVLLSLGECH